MKNFKKIFFTVLVLVLFSFSARAENLLLMPLGDSLTSGYQGGAGFAWSYGYRWKLQNLLGPGTYDFVGNLVGPTNESDVYDRDHEGHNGWRSDEIKSIVQSTLATNMATVDGYSSFVLLLAGTNDLLEWDTDDANLDSYVANISDMIGMIDQFDPRINVIVGLLPPMRAAEGIDVVPFNTRLAAMVNSYPKPNLLLVDMYSAFVANPDWETDYMFDNVHPLYTDGYDVMADVWYAGMQDLLVDTDGDGTPDTMDNCPDDPDKTEPGLSGCGNPEDTGGKTNVPVLNGIWLLLSGLSGVLILICKK